jgi:REP element-mobilizing transposase RayT
MPSTYTSLHYHIIFSTKDRIGWISKDWRDRLHAYLGGVVRGLGAVPLAIGGVEDHVHLLVGLNASHRIDYFLRDVKADSSAWIHDIVERKIFCWQRGYAAFSVSPSKLEGVKQYILCQEAHHRIQSFHEELKELLNENGIEYNEKYLF